MGASVKALTLEGIMKRFDLPRLIQIHNRCASGCAMLKEFSQSLETADNTIWIDLLSNIESYCKEVGFNHAAAKAFGIRIRLNKFPGEFTGFSLAAHIEGIKDDVDICMFSHQFIQIERQVQIYLNASSLFGEATIKAFPSSANDMKDVGECLAVDLNSAAVFHLMHIVEWGLRALCVNLKVNKIKKGPIEYATWDDILKKLPEVVDTKIDAMSRGPEKQKAQEFYHPALKEIRSFKDAWRNHIMHTRAAYTREDAVAVFGHVQRFMQGLANYGIKEI
jgi:hypothetical protein